MQPKHADCSPAVTHSRATGGGFDAGGVLLGRAAADQSKPSQVREQDEGRDSDGDQRGDQHVVRIDPKLLVHARRAYHAEEVELHELDDVQKVAEGWREVDVRGP